MVLIMRLLYRMVTTVAAFVFVVAVLLLSAVIVASIAVLALAEEAIGRKFLRGKV
jgi:hypothetical protein